MRNGEPTPVAGIPVSATGVRPSMTKEELLVCSGTITEQLPNGMFRVKLEDDREILTTVKAKLRRLRFRMMVGDRVDIEMTPYDLTKGRINFWHR